MFAFTIMTGLIIPIMMILCGLYFVKANLPEPNALFGYRTTRSMKNNDTWVFSNRLMGKYWLKSGIYVTILTVIVFIFLSMSRFSFDEDSLGIILMIILFGQMIFMCIPIHFVEKALKENFDENGNRRV